MDNENCQNNSNIKFDLIITSRVFPKLPERFEMVSSLEFRWVFRSAVAEIGGDRVSGSACWSAEAASECEDVCGAFAGSTPTCDSLKPKTRNLDYKKVYSRLQNTRYSILSSNLSSCYYFLFRAYWIGRLYFQVFNGNRKLLLKTIKTYFLILILSQVQNYYLKLMYLWYIRNKIITICHCHKSPSN